MKNSKSSPPVARTKSKSAVKSKPTAKSTAKSKPAAKSKSAAKSRSAVRTRPAVRDGETGARPVQAPSLAAAFARFLPVAQRIPAERVLVCRQDVNLIFANVRTGVAAVLPHLKRLKAELPALAVGSFTELEPLAGALLHAAAQVAAGTVTMSRQERDLKLGRLHELRAPMLLCAEALALLDLLPRQRVEQIRSGSGPFDAAQDGVALADLYTEYAAALHDKQPFTKELLAEIAGLGHELMRAIRPDGARPGVSREAAAASEARDRLYSLLVERYTDLRRAGFYLFGEDMDDKVPLLGARRSRIVSTPAVPADPPPPPAPAPLPAAPAAG